jgi:hypothetical protein
MSVDQGELSPSPLDLDPETLAEHAGSCLLHELVSAIAAEGNRLSVSVEFTDAGRVEALTGNSGLRRPGRPAGPPSRRIDLDQAGRGCPRTSRNTLR